MKIRIAAIVACLFVILPIVAHTQEGTTSDPLVRVIELPQPVYFSGADNASVLVPQGEYWVLGEEAVLSLYALDDGREFRLAGQVSTHEEMINETVATQFAGGDDHPDAHYIVLMYAEGQQLIVQGSYSGVQARSVLSKARNEKAKAKAAAQARLKQADKNARRLAAEKAQRARELAQSAGAAAGQVAETIQEAVPGAALQELVEAANKIGVVDLLACLKNARGSRQGNIGSLASEFARDPSAAVRSLRAEFEQSVNARLGDFSDAIDRLGPTPSPGQVTDAAFGLLRQIGNDKPAVGCLLAIVEPNLQQLKRDIIREQQALLANAEQTVNQTIMPALVNKLQDQVAAFALGNENPVNVQTRGVIRQVGTAGVAMVAMRKWEREAMAAGLFAQSLSDQYTAAANQINNALNHPEADVQEIRAAIDSTLIWSEDSALRFGVGMIRYRGHRAVDNSDGAISKKIKNNERIEAFGRRIAIKVVGGVCGLVPEAGAFICNAVFIPVEAISIWVVQKTVTGIIEGSMHKLWGKGVDALENNLVNRRNVAPSDAGPFYPMLNLLRAEDIALSAERDLPPGFRDAFSEYNTAVKRALDRWEEDRQ